MSDPAVWYCIPSARADGGTLTLWKERGYKLAVQRDPGAPEPPRGYIDLLIEHEWDGYPKAVNRLCREVLQQWPETLVCVTGGDDVEPDMQRSPEQIQRGFLGLLNYSSTYTVMQPTGDPWTDSQGRVIERIAGSPWMGRDWILKSMGGNGPLYDRFWHYYEDEHLQRAAKAQGVFWQCPDVCQIHRHWTRPGLAGRPPQRPAFLELAQQRWDSDRRIFAECEMNEFRESLPV